MDKVEKLYKNFGILADAKDKISEHEKEFIEILEAVKGSSNEKRLASQFIARFFKHFPHLIDQAIDALLDLLEDDDTSIRKQAIKDLPSLTKDNPENLLKIADVVAQMLATNDTTELSTVHNSLMTLFKIDAKGTFRGLFSQIVEGDAIVRERAIKFLGTKFKSISEDIMTKDGEDCLLEESKKVLKDVTASEFLTFMQMLSNLKIAKTVSGQQQLVDIVAKQAELDKEFEYDDPDIVNRLIQCVNLVLPFFSCMVHSTRFVVYICQQVIPVLSELKNPGESIDVQLELLNLLAELCPHCEALENPKENMQIIFNKLLEYMPLPPIEENSENALPQENPKLQFSYVESLMYAFHQLGRKNPDFLTGEENAELLKDFKLRLQYFARGIQGYIKTLRESLQGKKAEELKTEENKLKVVALKTISNINTLIRDLFHNPPSYKSNISLSWKPLPTSVPATPLKRQHPNENSDDKGTPGAKRQAHTPITFDEDATKTKKLPVTAAVVKGPREIYMVPSGKYSTKVKNFSLPLRGNGGRGARRGRGGFGRGQGQSGRGNWFY